MEFYPYRTNRECILYSLAELEDIRLKTPEEYTEDMLLTKLKLLTELDYIVAKRPFYRIWPGVLEFILKMNLSEFNTDFEILFKNLPEKIFSVELPTDDSFSVTFSDSFGDNQRLSSIIIQQLNDNVVICPQVEDTTLNSLPAVLPVESFGKCVNHDASEARGLIVYSIILGIFAIGQNPDLIKRLVLKRDKQKFERTGETDEKYIQRAMRNGLIGYDVGRNVPTSEQIHTMAKSGLTDKGKKTSHLRAPHLSLYWTGHGAVKTPRIRLIDTIFVNADDAAKLPTGYYGPNPKK